MYLPKDTLAGGSRKGVEDDVQQYLTPQDWCREGHVTQVNRTVKDGNGRHKECEPG